MASRADLPPPLGLLTTVSARMSRETRGALRKLRLALGDITATAPVSVAHRGHEMREDVPEPASRKPVGEPAADPEPVDL